MKSSFGCVPADVMILRCGWFILAYRIKNLGKKEGVSPRLFPSVRKRGLTGPPATLTNRVLHWKMRDQSIRFQSDMELASGAPLLLYLQLKLSIQNKPFDLEGSSISWDLGRKMQLLGMLRVLTNRDHERPYGFWRKIHCIFTDRKLQENCRGDPMSLSWLR